MKSVFISGSMSIKFLPNEVITSFNKIIAQNIQVYVGDADGIDTLTQNYFASKNYANVTVCTIKEYPRNLVSNIFDIKKISCDESIKSEREKQTSKDGYMTQTSDYSFVIWDGKSKGSFANIQRALKSGKKLKVYHVGFNRCLEKEELTLSHIENIYKSNTGYTASEIVAKIKASNIYTNITKVDELKEWFVTHKIFKQYQNKVEIDSNYKDYFIVENYRGNQTIKYKKDVLELISENSIFGVRE
ncbi:hypothetical protein Flexsi_0384 [Flexistipes sinusarabici DSM 4947]|uniref:Uncharacterized protein n=1 Tax=Flexistipes sinusarabici (strain ATCC 49648 / DSM 4947 / MAS 10) TaxID=717231 RepID=F8E8U8_FLESM|nr:hypothetical protein [Flexistipes sinusarabici]AEI14072.1 hypothetical protein Flexsi_0384 [Flexistipes sinusarabici DSM 4947]